MNLSDDTLKTCYVSLLEQLRRRYKIWKENMEIKTDYEAKRKTQYQKAYLEL